MKQAVFSLAASALLMTAKANGGCDLDCHISSLEATLAGTCGPKNCLTTSIWGGPKCVYTATCDDPTRLYSLFAQEDDANP